ncbi:MAG TPA: GNAT family N-acetyltransferase [Acidimicrobiales bacterium]|nr:GNAT family N-acetyltransferase [Acidimicrobiales bacterium]
MTAPTDDMEVVDLPAESRFVVRGPDAVAELVYHLNEKRLVLVHTEVPESWGGRGTGGRLVRATLARARAEHLTIVPWCPFARRWLKEHPDEAGGVDIDFATPPPD